MSNIYSALLHSSLGRYLLKLIGLFSTIVIARLLTPQEVGTFAVASSVVMLMADFKLLGASTYLIRERELTENKIRSAYGLTIIICWSMGVLIFASAYHLSLFFNIPEVMIVFMILAVSFFVAPYISIPNALLTREYRFKEVNYIKISAAVGQIVLTVLLIYLGYSFYSLAWGHLLSVLIQLVMSIYYTRETKIYLPIFNGISPIAKMGIFTTISGTLRHAQLTIPDVIIGRMGTPTQVGIFSRGLGFINFVYESILAGVLPVSQPYLSKKKNSNENVSDAYLKATGLILGVTWPVLVVASFASYPMIKLMFGENWLAAAPYASILAYWGMFRAAVAFVPQALIAEGKEKLLFYKETFIFLVFLSAIILSFQYGLKMVSLAFCSVAAFDFFISYLIIYKVMNIPFLRLLKFFFDNFILAFLFFSIMFIVDGYSPYKDYGSLIYILSLALFLPPVWAFLLYLLKHPIYFEVVRMIRKIK